MIDRLRAARVRAGASLSQIFSAAARAPFAILLAMVIAAVHVAMAPAYATSGSDLAAMAEQSVGIGRADKEPEPEATPDDIFAPDPLDHARPPQESAKLGLPGKSVVAGTFGPDGIQNDEEEVADEAGTGNLIEHDMLQVLGALAVVIGLLFVTRFVFTRASNSMAGGGRPSGVVEILARYPVARGQQLMLLKVARRVLVVHQNGTAMTTLSEIVDENEVAALLGRVEAGTAKSESGGFKSIFARYASEHDQAGGGGRGPGATPDQGEVIDLTRRPGSLRSLFSAKGSSR